MKGLFPAGEMKMDKGCKCINEMNQELGKHNTRLSLMITFDGGTYPAIGTEQIERGRGKARAKAVLPTYCPFCGAKYDHA
jgi:hypothetical protein